MPKMKLSDAILKGCEGTEQYFGEFFDESGKACCALGAAIIGGGICPGPVGCGVDFDKYFGVPPGTCDEVIRWNDNFRLTREQIAAMLKEMGL